MDAPCQEVLDDKELLLNACAKATELLGYMRGDGEAEIRGAACFLYIAGDAVENRFILRRAARSLPVPAGEEPGR